MTVTTVGAIKTTIAVTQVAKGYEKWKDEILYGLRSVRM